MKKYRMGSLLLLTLLLLLLAFTSAQAMDSTNYSLDWFTPMTTNGGGVSTSTNYAINVTVGQTVRGNSASTNYAVRMGFWQVWDEVTLLFKNFLTIILGNPAP